MVPKNKDARPVIPWVTSVILSIIIVLMEEIDICFFNVVIQALAHVEPVSIMVRGLPLKFAHNSGVKTVNEDEKNQRSKIIRS